MEHIDYRLAIKIIHILAWNRILNRDRDIKLLQHRNIKRKYIA